MTYDYMFKESLRAGIKVPAEALEGLKGQAVDLSLFALQDVRGLLNVLLHDLISLWQGPLLTQIWLSQYATLLLLDMS